MQIITKCDIPESTTNKDNGLSQRRNTAYRKLTYSRKSNSSNIKRSTKRKKH